MITNRTIRKKAWRGLTAAAVLSACLMNFTACSKYDLDEVDPEGWGGSIYAYLQEQNSYTTTIRLIDDLGMSEVLAKTGSKTLFVANDDAYNRFFASNKWGVTSYDQLSTSQKKMLLYGSMINNSYQIHDLASLEGPIKGQSMRRLSSQAVLDTVSVVKVTDLPNMRPEDGQHNQSWLKFQDRGEIVLMKDRTQKPMLTFIEAQMTNNKITNDDYNFLYNYETDRQPGDASINGVKVLRQNIKCSNGFVHEMEDVVMSLDNMADIIASKPSASIFNRLLQRFSAPFFAGVALTEQYNHLNGTAVDSVFEKRFFSKKSRGGASVEVDDDNRTMRESLLRFDPEWNSYYSGNPVPTADVALCKDMAVMMVPSDEAMNRYWNEGNGIILKNQYGTWDAVPNRVVAELINNNMLASFVESVPSKFDGILNDANDPMGVEKEAIDSVWLGCNGAVFLTNEVYPPTSFVSVLYPTIVNENMSILNWAVTKCQYNVYLNSLHSTYSFFMPNNGALLQYVDPVSYGQTETKVYQFHYDPKRPVTVWAAVYKYDLATRTVGDSITEVTDEYSLRSRLKDVLDNHIVVGDVADGSTYYRTKGGQELRVNNAAAGKNGMTVEGSLQINETLEPIRVVDIYNQENGNVYIIDEPILTTRYSVLDMMRQYPEMDEMTKLLEGSALRETIHDERYACVSENLSIFNTYHYTVYVPTNESILQLQADGKLPTWDDVAKWEEQEDFAAKTRDSLAIENFLRYHIQDNALFVGAKPEAEEQYETGLINERTGRFERLTATLEDDALYVKTSSTDPNPRRVLTESGIYNIMAREYQVEGTDALEAKNVWTTSTAVIHLIDGPLLNNK